MGTDATIDLDPAALLNVLAAFRKGDFSVRMPIDRTGLGGKIADALNEILALQAALFNECVRVAGAVGKEGQINQRVEVAGALGGWAVLIGNVNGLVTDLVKPMNEVSRVIGAVAQGDLTQAVPIEVNGRPLAGEFLRSAKVVNGMVHELCNFTSEVTRVASEVGTEGKLGGQAVVKGGAGIWKDLTDNVNSMAANLTSQVRNIAEVTTAVANGDLSKKITVDARGELLKLKDTVNTMVDQLRAFAAEVTRVAREVGTDGKLGGQAVVPGVGGTWKDLTDSVNAMASNLTSQVRSIAEVTTAVANGDLGKQITVDVQGEILELKDTINTMVEQLRGFASEVTRVAREVGTEGKLGGQALVQGVGGVWAGLTDSVNQMANNLTTQVRNIAEVTTAVANGNLTKKITVDVQGEILELKGTINTMVDQLGSFAAEVTRVAREVGTEGKLGGQAVVGGVAGIWKDLTDNVNAMAGNLTVQLRDVAKVATSIAAGDLSKKITVPVKGEILQIKETINTMVDQLNAFAGEVSRVAREVGTDGKLGGQANVRGSVGTWKDLTDKVNLMASNLTGQVRNIAEVATAIANGDLSKKITVEARGEIKELKTTINTMVEQLTFFASEVTRVAREVGTEGKLGGQAFVKGVAGTWKDLTDNVNQMASNLTGQVRNIADVTTAVANGDLSRKITAEAQGEIRELKNTINTMVDQLSAIASEVTRVAREVGTDGKLGGQAYVRGVGGTWKDLVDNVNLMASNLTTQVRTFAKVVTAVAKGDLNRKLVLEARGEIAELAETINSMIDTLALFGDQVATVAREVGIEGRLGGQAHVPGAAGLWRNLTDNVNQLAGNLTSQVRAIAEVATAVTAGNLSRTITVEAPGEVAALKDNINEMIRNLRETTNRNNEQDWLKTNLARFTRMLQGQRDLLTVANQILSELAPLVSAHYGVFYLASGEGEGRAFKLIGSYAFKNRKSHTTQIEPGEGLVGQAALEKERILISEVPPDYFHVTSGLGHAAPANLVVLPVLFEGQVKAVLELASLNRFSEVHLAFLEQLTESIGIVLNTISAAMRKEELLKESQALASELQRQQEHLQHANEELEARARLLSRQKGEVEGARASLQEKAEQLALASRYKSEFLANMSHELRTPLNSLLMLSRTLEENAEGNLSPRQREYAATIHSAGSDLLALINEVLDLAKIESGTMTMEWEDVPFQEVLQFVVTTFQTEAEGKGLAFPVTLEPGLPRSLQTDPRRLQQILRNLLSNAFKFTEKGSVEVRIGPAARGWSRERESLNQASGVAAFSVEDTGIGIDPAKHWTIFEAFQQADGTTSRRYGGTGLGLSISREIARMFGGEITLQSAPGKGSLFTLYLPLTSPQRGPARETREEPAMSGSQKMSMEEVEGDPTLDGRTILIVDDDIRNRFALTALLEAQRLRVLAAESGREALECLAAHPEVALVFMDLMLPEMDGVETIRAIRTLPSCQDLPVVALTAKAMRGDRERSLAAGASAYLTKPADAERILSVLRLALTEGKAPFPPRKPEEGPS